MTSVCFGNTTDYQVSDILLIKCFGKLPKLSLIFMKISFTFPEIYVRFVNYFLLVAFMNLTQKH